VFLTSVFGKAGLRSWSHMSRESAGEQDVGSVWKKTGKMRSWRPKLRGSKKRAKKGKKRGSIPQGRIMTNFKESFINV
jgi:hypothetical protein